MSTKSNQQQTVATTESVENSSSYVVDAARVAKANDRVDNAGQPDQCYHINDQVTIPAHALFVEGVSRNGGTFAGVKAEFLRDGKSLQKVISAQDLIGGGLYIPDTAKVDIVTEGDQKVAYVSITETKARFAPCDHLKYAVEPNGTSRGLDNGIDIVFTMTTAPCLRISKNGWNADNFSFRVVADAEGKPKVFQTTIAKKHS